MSIDFHAVGKELAKIAAAHEPHWKVSGLVQGALNGRPEDFGLRVEEEFPGDPWIAALGNHEGMPEPQFQSLLAAHRKDPDGKGKPFYFVAQHHDEPPVVVFQGQAPMSFESAKQYGRSVGIDEKQLDFKHKLGGQQKTALAKLAAISLDIEKGDTLLGGRFKNHEVKVEEIGEDELGQPTINGRKLLAYRIKKVIPK